MYDLNSWYRGGNLKSIRLAASAMLCSLAVGSAFGSTPIIGMASAQNGIVLDDSRVTGNATLFDGSKVKATGYSRINLKNGTRLDLATDSRMQIFANRATLVSGTSEIQSPSGFEIEARTLRILTSEASSIARIRLDGSQGVLVTALNAPVSVFNQNGLLVARVKPGFPLSFLPQAAASGTFDGTGCVLQKSGAAVLVEDNGNKVTELRGDLRKTVGSQYHVVGTVDSSATPAGGASQVVNVTKADLTQKGGCSALAAKVGAVTTAAGLGAGAAAGAAAAGAAGAGVGASTAALVVVGVAVAGGAAVGGLAASGALTTSSP